MNALADLVPDTPADAPRQVLLQAGLDLIEQGFVLIDAQLRVQAWNLAFVRLLDLPAEQVCAGMPFEALLRFNAQRGEYGPGDPEQQVAERMEAVRRYDALACELRRPNGQVLWLREVPLPGVGLVRLYTDITAQRQAEALILQHAAELERRVAERTAELRRSEEQLRLITDSIPALVAYVDGARRYRYANRGYRDWFGLDVEQPDTISARGFLGPQTYAAIRPQISRAFAGEAVSFEYDITRRDGSVVRVRTSLVPDIAPDGRVAGCFELTFDITEQQRAQDMVLKAQKMEALGQLTGGLAHDFNNLLTVVVGNLGLLVRERPDAPEVREYVQPALQAAGRGVDLVRRLLSFARRQPLTPAAVDVAQVAASVTRIIARTLPEGLALELCAGRGPLWAWLDASELENAVLNLLLNARDATGGRGRVQVRTEACRLDDDEAQRRHMAPGRCVRLLIRDDGRGMDSVTLQRIYEPFFTTKPPGSGTGLGLSMVYGFVTQSRGAIEVRSAVGAGTTVSLWLPACEAPADGPFDHQAPAAGQHHADDSAGMATPAPPQGEPDAATLALIGPSTARPATRGLALLVEDDADVRRVVRRSLLELGYTVVEADNGVEARDILAYTQGIALLLTDVVMPGGVDGRTLAREARTLHQVPRVLMMSGHAPVAPEPGLPLLQKPFTKAQLASALALADGC